ncbi:MAG: DUF1972 domain-containing protein, partial [Bryobacteraceae bacterium]
MRIAIAGTRGIPASYGGFETFAEEISTRLAARGHHVIVYCRSPHDSPYRGVELRYLPAIRHKYFETIAHTGISTLHLLVNRVDAVLYCNGANAIFTWMPRLAGMPTVLNVDGLERKRKKWNRLARSWYHLSEYLSTFCPTEVVTDARSIERYYRDTYGKSSSFIPYGAPVGKVVEDDVVRSLGLRPGGYFLYVSRMEPENNPLLVRQEFEKARTDFQLALIGDAPYAHEYIRQVKETADPRILIPGAVYGRGYHQLGSHCFAYIHATEVGGTHPALIEAMGRGALVLYLDTEENREVAGGAGVPFDLREGSLREGIERVLAMSDDDRARLRAAAMDRVRERYSWEA